VYPFDPPKQVHHRPEADLGGTSNNCVGEQTSQVIIY